MKFQDQVVKQTQKALDDLCRAAAALPIEQREWSPGGDARTALDQMREIAMGAAWLLPVVTSRNSEAFDEHPAGEAGMRAMPATDELTSIEDCVRLARMTTNDLCQAIVRVSDETLEEEVTLPFGGGMVMTCADLLGMHGWNLVYHLGQINQIALIHGDREMH